jgi:hypothetical protein
MRTKKENRAARMAADQAMADGITKHKTSLPATMSVSSQQVTPDNLIAVYEGLVASAKTVLAAEAAHAAAIKADKDKRAQVRTIATGGRRLIVAMYLASPDTLQDFGLVPPKTAVRSAANKATAASKAVQTRKVLGTKGTRQKKEALAAADTVPPVPAAAPPASPTPTATTGATPTKPAS